MSSILFFADAGPNIGMGHLSRCRSLAKEINRIGGRCVMVGPSLIFKTDVDSKIFKKWYEIKNQVSELDIASYLIEVAKDTNCDKIILDDYRVNSKFQKLLLKNNYEWLQFDWACNKNIWAKWILNASPIASSELYKPFLKSKKQTLLLGPQYALLGAEFFSKKTYETKTRQCKNIFISFGGGNDLGAIIIVLSQLYDLKKDLFFHVVSGEMNQNNKKNKDFIKNKGYHRVKFYLNPNSIFDIMMKCDLAILAGGTMTFEAVHCRLPMIIISIANNQVNQSIGWENIGVAKYLGDLSLVSNNGLKSAFQKCINERFLVQARETLDRIKINGANLIAKKILE